MSAKSLLATLGAAVVAAALLAPVSAVAGDDEGWYRGDRTTWHRVDRRDRNDRWDRDDRWSRHDRRDRYCDRGDRYSKWKSGDKVVHFRGRDPVYIPVYPDRHGKYRRHDDDRYRRSYSVSHRGFRD